MRNVVGISEGASLGMHAMAFLAANEGESVSIKVMADRLNGSANHLSKIMQRLGKADLVSSKRGPKGGFLLNRGMEAISLLEIHEAIEGEFKPSECLLSKKICRGGRCIFGDSIRKSNEMVYEHLKNTSLAELVGVFK